MFWAAIFGACFKETQLRRVNQAEMGNTGFPQNVLPFFTWQSIEGSLYFSVMFEGEMLWMANPEPLGRWLVQANLLPAHKLWSFAHALCRMPAHVVSSGLATWDIGFDFLGAYPLKK